jgi:tRNA pseudouridine55 synthase
LVSGLLLIDKPSGLTSHDVVARMRRTLRERSIGHTGTLDPMATGLLLLVVGRATRLASLLTGHDKTYDATIRLGQTTNTDDAEGEFTGPELPVPDESQVRAALERFTGTFAQVPPAHSARKVQGERAYKLARANKPVELAASQVTVHDREWQGFDGRDLRIRVRVSAGFYVRSLARDLGSHLGCGGHLVALRRVQSGVFLVADALPLAEAEAQGPELASRLIPAVELTEDGLKRVLHGNTVGPAQVRGPLPAAGSSRVRLVADGRLVALARPEAATLHPVVVLG